MFLSIKLSAVGAAFCKIKARRPCVVRTQQHDALVLTDLKKKNPINKNKYQQNNSIIWPFAGQKQGQCSDGCNKNI